MGVQGLAWAAVIVSAVEVSILFYVMSKRIPGLFDTVFVHAVARMASAAGFTAIITYVTLVFLPLSANDQSFWASFPKFAFVAAVAGVCYIAFSRLFKLPEVNPIITRVVKIFFKAPKAIDK